MHLVYYQEKTVNKLIAQVRPSILKEWMILELGQEIYK